jgi:hypothetical protein
MELPTKSPKPGHGPSAGLDIEAFKRLAPWILSLLLGANYGMDVLNIASKDELLHLKDTVTSVESQLKSHESQPWHSGSGERFIRLESQQEGTTEKVDEVIAQMNKANSGIQEIKEQLVELKAKRSGNLEVD